MRKQTQSPDIRVKDDVIIKAPRLEFNDVSGYVFKVTNKKVRKGDDIYCVRVGQRDFWCKRDELTLDS